MDDYDAPSMRFGLDNDFEEGQFGEDGEFYAAGVKKGKLQSKNKAMYGVFDDSSDDEGGRRKGPKKKADYSAPVGFVSGGLKKGAYEEEEEKKSGKRAKRWSSEESADDDEESRKDEEEEDESDDHDMSRPRFGKIKRRQAGGGAKKGARMDDDSGDDSDRVSQREVELPAEFGVRREERKKKVERKEEAVDYTSLRRLQGINAGGLGLKLLQKMGYKGGGLGKDGTGIAQALEAKQRGNLEGLGMRKEHKLEVKAKEDEEKEKKKAPQKKKKKEFNWKIDLGDDIDKPKKVKKVYKTAEEIRMETEDKMEGGSAAAKSVGAAPVSIVDMRGKEARLVSGGQIAEILDVEADEAFTLPLLHNVSVLVDSATADIQRLTRQSASEKDNLVALEAEHKTARARVDEGEYHLTRLEAIISLIESTYKRAISPQSLTLDALADVFEELRTMYKAEYQLYQLSKLAGPLIVPPYRTFLASWRPLEEPEMPVAATKAWRWLLRADGMSKSAAHTHTHAHTPLAIEDAAVNSADAEAFLQLVEEVVMPKLVGAAANWTPKTPQTQQLVRLLEAWEEVLPLACLKTLLHTLVLPKLKTEVDGWNPRLDPIPVHSWLHPWLPLAQNELEDLYPVLRYKIGVALAEWHPGDMSALNILRPWASVFQAQHMEALLARCVLPKLAIALRQLPINPANQVLEPFHWIIGWVDTAPLHHIATIFETEFFPRWINILFQWLTAKPDYEEVTRWYLNWKGLFPEALARQESVKLAFTRALDMMNNVVAGAQIVGKYVQEGVQENLQYLKVTEERSKDDRKVGRTEAKVLEKPRISIADAMYNNSVSFKEALERLAEDRGLLMLPKPGKQQNGKQVYSFGQKLTVYLDNRIVYALIGGEWKPLALDELLSKAAK